METYAPYITPLIVSIIVIYNQYIKKNCNPFFYTTDF